MEIIKVPKSKRRNIYSEKLNVAAYIRVSTKLEQQASSYESQYNYYKNRIEQNINWNLVEIYGDDGITGTSIKARDSFKKMIIDSRNGKIDLILTKSVSRFARNTEDTLKYIRELKKLGIGIIFEEENINTLDMTSEFILSVMASVAQLESNNAKSRKSYSFDMQLNTKGYKDTKETYGYKKSKRTGELIIVTKEANVIRKIYEMYLNDFNNEQIASYLNSQNIKTKRGIKWTKNNVSRILINQKYTGVHIVRKYIKGKSQIIEDNNPAIISKDIFEQVQQRRLSRRNREYGINDKTSFFTGKIRCNFCGRVFSKTIAFNNEYNWYCSNNIYRHKCDSKGISIELVKNAFIQLMINIYLLDLKSKKNNIKKLNNKKDNLVNKLYILVNQFMNKKISKYEYEREKILIDSQISEIDSQLIKEELAIAKEDVDRTIISNLQNEIRNLLSNDFSEELFDKIIKFVIIGDKYKNGRKNFFVIRFIGKDNIFDEDNIDFKFITNNDYRKIYQFDMNTNFHILSNSKKYKYIKKIKVSYELLEVE